MIRITGNSPSSIGKQAAGKRPKRRKAKGMSAAAAKAPPKRSTRPSLSLVPLPRLVHEPAGGSDLYRRSHILTFAEARRRSPTLAEARLEFILSEIGDGALQGRFVREHVISGKWIVDFFIPEIRLAIEVDGGSHDTVRQKERDRRKEADCRRFDITLLRLRNATVLGDPDRLVELLRSGWRQAKRRENLIIGQ